MTASAEKGQIRKLRGIAVSPGIIIGKARLIDRSRVRIFYHYLINEEQTSHEVRRFKEATEAAKRQIVDLKARMPDHIKDHSFILDSHLMIMDDSMLYDSTVDFILKEKINAEWALKKSIQRIKQLFDEIQDEYIRDRYLDVENVAERILRHLVGKEEENLAEITERAIIVAHDLSPVDTGAMNVGKIKGFITDAGGKTSHTAIIAKSLKIPAVVGLESATSLIQDGGIIIVDGNRGEVILDPDDETIIDYQERQLQHERFESNILRSSHLPAETLDGYRVAIEANIEFPEEVVLARDYGAEGIGLYRTEFHYLRGQEIPGEEELFDAYREVAEIMAPSPVTIRTLDLGGDKFSSISKFQDLRLKKETNPALGLRAIRFCLKEQEIFKTQLRAILRASAFGNMRLMFPMISGLQEIREAQAILEEVRDGLEKDGIPYDPGMRIGIMIEVPSAVAMADILAKYVDFFSIGTNDLIQYALAIDRINEEVAYMYQPFHPAIIRMIKQVVDIAKGTGISVALCGEMAADPMCAYLLLGMGVDELSMNSRGIPLIKKLVRSISLEETRADVGDVALFETAREIREFVMERMGPFLESPEYRNSQDLLADATG
ncbi:MAG: phosphoenolpyruvate--protein phosphotransferase [Deltaproteobacteria bacterium]|nr:phosphoenolpyruvate--protein phosphotransferase [Deltaproteobacteria bacterium]MBW2063306.1 phosphoenolpyruvate--protein phosphotransferase [Deltaproteobacteria bacterium]